MTTPTGADAVVQTYVDAIETNTDGEPQINEGEQQAIEDAWQDYNPQQDQQLYAEVSAKLAELGYLPQLMVAELGTPDALQLYDTNGNGWYDKHEVEAINQGLIPSVTIGGAAAAPEAPISHDSRLIASGFSQNYDVIELMGNTDELWDGDPSNDYHDDQLAGQDDIVAWEESYDPGVAFLFGQVGLASENPPYFHDVAAKLMNGEPVSFEDFVAIRDQDRAALAASGTAIENGGDPSQIANTLTPGQRQFVDWVLMNGVVADPSNISPWLRQVAPTTYGTSFETGDDYVSSLWAGEVRKNPVKTDDLGVVLGFADRVAIARNTTGSPVLSYAEWQVMLADPNLPPETREALIRVDANIGRYLDAEGNLPDGRLDIAKANIDLNKVAFAYEGDSYEAHRQASDEVPSDEVFEAASLIRAAVNGGTKEEIIAIITPLSLESRKQLAVAYEAQYHVAVADDAAMIGAYDTGFTDPVFGAQVDAELKRVGNDADVAGEIHVKLTDLSDGGNAETEREIRSVLGSLTPENLEAVKKKYLEDYGRELETELMESQNLSEASKLAVKQFLHPTENPDHMYLEVAKIGLKSANLEIYTEAMKQMTEEGRRWFREEGGAQALIDAAFPNADEREIASDHLEVGRTRVDTFVRHSQSAGGILARIDEDSIARTSAEAADEEKELFAAGERLEREGKQPQTAEETAAVEFYNAVHGAFNSAAGNDPYKVAKWEALLRNSPQLVIDLLGAHDYGSLGFFHAGAGTNTDIVYSSIENLSAEDWQYLRDHPEAKRDVLDVLQILNVQDDGRALGMLDAKIEAETFEASRFVGRRPVDEILAGNPTAAEVAEAVIYMSPAEQEKYRSDEGYRNQIEQGVARASNFIEPDDLVPITLTQRALERIGRGEPALAADGKYKLIDDILLSSTNGASALTIVSQVENLFVQFPELKEELQRPENAAISTAIHRAVNASINSDLQLPANGRVNSESALGDYYGLEGYIDPLFAQGKLPLELKVNLASTETERLQVLAAISAEDRELLLTQSSDPETLAWQTAILGKSPERNLRINVIESGELDSTDSLRALVLGGNATSDEYLNILTSLTDEEKAVLAGDYFVRYGELIGVDILSKIDGPQRQVVENALQGVELSESMEALRILTAAHQEDAFMDGFMAMFWDWSKYGMEESAMQLFPTALKLQEENLSAEDRVTLEAEFAGQVANFLEAASIHAASKEAAKEAFFAASIMAIALATAPITAGGSLAATIAKDAAIGAAYKVLVGAAFEGTQYDISDVPDDVVSGALAMTFARTNIAALPEVGGGSVFARSVAMLSRSSYAKVQVSGVAATIGNEVGLIAAGQHDVNHFFENLGPALAMSLVAGNFAHGGSVVLSRARTATSAGAKIVSQARNAGEAIAGDFSTQFDGAIPMEEVVPGHWGIEPHYAPDGVEATTDVTDSGNSASPVEPQVIDVEPIHISEPLPAEPIKEPVIYPAAPESLPMPPPPRGTSDAAIVETPEIVAAPESLPMPPPPGGTSDVAIVETPNGNASTVRPRPKSVNERPAAEAVAVEGDAASAGVMRKHLLEAEAESPGYLETLDAHRNDPLSPDGLNTMIDGLPTNDPRWIPILAALTYLRDHFQEIRVADGNDEMTWNDALVFAGVGPSATASSPPPSNAIPYSAPAQDSLESAALRENFFTGDKVLLDGRVATKQADGSYVFLVPAGDTLFDIRNDIAAAIGEPLLEPGLAVYNDPLLLELKLANAIQDPDMIYAGATFVIPATMIAA